MLHGHVHIMESRPCAGHKMLQCASSPAGQRLFATRHLLQQKGIDLTDGAQAVPWSQTDFLITLDDICAAFWATVHGLAMRDQLDNHPFNKCELEWCSKFLNNQ